MTIHARQRKHRSTHLSVLAACIIAGVFLVQCGGGDSVQIIQEPLPYAQDALEPVISAKTLEYHYGKHYAGYVEKANSLIKGKVRGAKSVEDVILLAAGDDSTASIFNNAAQAYNHAFFFKCLKPEGGGVPEGMLGEMIAATFGSYEKFKSVFITAAKDQFGSGWVWLVLDEDELSIIATANADTPIAHELTPLFTVDVWEHAYYLDYQNRRTDFVAAVLDNLANWDFVSDQLEKALPAKERPE